jgi:hypothetical protein
MECLSHDIGRKVDIMVRCRHFFVLGRAHGYAKLRFWTVRLLRVSPVVNFFDAKKSAT